MSEFFAIFIGSLTSASLLLAAHCFLWNKLDKLTITARYTIGVAGIALGCTVTAGLLNNWLIAITMWTVSGVSGVVIVSAWWIRGLLDERGHREERALDLARRAQEVTRGTGSERDSQRD